jgi:hypothetical protein
MAIRMSQALRSNSDFSYFISDMSSEMAVIRQEIRDRTIWSCFVMDRLLSCGKDRPTIFVTTDMNKFLPLSEEDFAFGEVREERSYIKPWTSEAEVSKELWTIEHYFAILLQGVDIWATMAKWTADGGRKKYHGPNDCPWNPNSAWNKVSRDLESWRSHQDERMKYSPVRIAAQVHQGNPQAFAYINLLYYLW